MDWILPRCLGRYPKWHARAQGMEADWPSMSMQIMLGTKCRSVTGIIMLLNNTRWYGSRKAENRWNLHVWFRARCSKIAISYHWDAIQVAPTRRTPWANRDAGDNMSVVLNTTIPSSSLKETSGMLIPPSPWSHCRKVRKIWTRPFWEESSWYQYKTIGRYSVSPSSWPVPFPKTCALTCCKGEPLKAVNEGSSGHNRVCSNDHSYWECLSLTSLHTYYILYIVWSMRGLTSHERSDKVIREPWGLSYLRSHKRTGELS
jgi:hypothetical protein